MSVTMNGEDLTGYVEGVTTTGSLDGMSVSERAAKLAEKFTKEFGGITYPEWLRLREGVEAKFQDKIREAEKSLCLCPDDDVAKIIRSRFG